MKRELEKIQDTLLTALMFHKRRDEMNAAGHLAINNVRYSPLTAALEIALANLAVLIAGTALPPSAAPVALADAGEQIHTLGSAVGFRIYADPQPRYGPQA
jgi:hypothetical protein